MILVLLCAICNPKAFDASPLLVDAARHNMLDVARVILSKFSFDINYQHEFYGSAFCTAVRQGARDIAWMLLEQPGVDIHIKNANKRNAAFFASMNEDRLMLEKLLEMGANTLDADAEDTIAEERTTSELATKIRDRQDLGIDSLSL